MDNHVEFWKEQMSKQECEHNWVVFENGTMVHPSEDGLSAMDIMRAIDDAYNENEELIEEYECAVLDADNAVVRFSGEYGNILVRCPFREVEEEMINHDRSKYSKEFLAEILCMIALDKRDADAKNRMILYENGVKNAHAEKLESTKKIEEYFSRLSTAIH